MSVSGFLTVSMIPGTLQQTLVNFAEIIAGVAAGLTAIVLAIGWLIRLTWPTTIKVAEAYSLGGEWPPTFVLQTRVRNRRKVDEQLVHYYVALIPWSRRVIPGWRRRDLLDEISLSACIGYLIPPTIKAGTGTTTWSTVTDGDRLVKMRRRQLIHGPPSYSYRRFVFFGEDTWHVNRAAHLVTGYDGRKATRKVRRRSGIPAIPTTPPSS